MKYTVEESLRNFQFWSGGKDTADGLTLEQIDTVESMMEDMSDDWTDTQINDFFWFDIETIYEWLGIDENGEKIGSQEWAENVLMDYVDKCHHYIVSDFLETYFDGDCEDKESLIDSFEEHAYNFRDLNGELLKVGDKVNWFDPAIEDHESDEEYDASTKVVHTISDISSSMVKLDDDNLEVLAEECEKIFD